MPDLVDAKEDRDDADAAQAEDADQRRASTGSADKAVSSVVEGGHVYTEEKGQVNLKTGKDQVKDLYKESSNTLFVMRWSAL